MGKMLIIVFFLTLIAYVVSQSYRVVIDCIRNCDDEKIDPRQEAELYANCTGICSSVKYTWWFMGYIPGNTIIQQLNQYIYFPNPDNKTIIIKKNVLPLENNSPYTVSLTAESPIFKFQINSQRLLHTRILNTTPASMNYGNDHAEFQANKLTAEEIQARIDVGEKQLKKLAPDSIAFGNLQQQLLIYLEDFPTNTKENIDTKMSLLKRITSANSTKVDPAVATHTIHATDQIAASKLAMIKKKRRPKEMAKEIKEFSSEMLNDLAKATSYSKQTLTEHQINVSTTKKTVSVIDTIFPTENYPDYNNFDVLYQAKKKTGQEMTKNLLHVLKNIGNANLLTMDTDQSESINEGYCLLNIVDENRKSIKRNYSICEATLSISNSLINELRSKLSITAITFCVVKKDIFWWTNDNSDSKYVFLEMSERKTNKLLVKLKNPVLFFVPANQSISEKKSGVFRMPVNKSYEELTDNDLTVHQVSIDYYLQALLIQFSDMESDDEFKVVIMINRRPSIKDFSSNYIAIPHKIATDEKYIILHQASASPGSFCYVAILPENKNKNEYNYNIHFSQVSCEQWDESLQNWNTEECSVNIQTNLKQIYCNCYHLSLFSLKSRNVKSRIIEYLEIEVEIQQEFNYVVLQTTGFVLFLYLLGIFLVLWINRRRLKRKRVLFLLDNKLTDKYEYYIVVYTGIKKYSQTTSNIGIKIYGTLGESTPHLLRGHYEPVLQTASEDWFYLLTEQYLGVINKIDLWSDCYGCRLNWYCEKIEVYDIKNNKKWLFEVYDWISVVNKKTECSVSPKERQTPVLKTRCDYALQGLNNHFWIRSFQKLNFPTFTSAERVTVMLSIIICNMNMSLCMLEIPTFNFISMNLGYGHFAIGILEVFIAVASSLISFLIHRIHIYLFSNSQNFNFRKIRTNAIFRYSIKVRAITWVSLIIILFINLSTLLVYGIWITYYSSVIWIVTSLIAVGLCIFIHETVYVMVWAAVKKKFRQSKLSLDISEITPMKEMIFRKYGKNGARPFFNMYYQPISEIEKKIKLEIETSRIEARNIVADIIMFSVYVIILFGVILLNQDSMAHYSAENIKNQLINELLDDVKTIDSLFEYLHDVLLPTVHTTLWYEGFSSNEAGLLKDFNTKMLGMPRLRQVRIKNNTCFVPALMKSYVSECNMEYQSRLEETKDFAPKWKSKYEHNRSFIDDTDEIWMYKNWYQSKTTSTLGHLAHYPAGGYLAPLGRTVQNSELILKYLKSTHWIDKLTRAIFIDLSFYNANENLFNILTIIFEKSASGHIKQSYSLRTCRLLFVNSEIRIAMAVAFIMFVIVIIVFAWKEVNKMQEYGLSKLLMFYKDPWNIIDFIIIILAFGFILIYFFRTDTVQQLMKDLENATNNEYVNFHITLYWEDCITVVGTLLIVISTVRIAKLLRFLRSFRICELTLHISAKYLIVMGINNFILIFAYSAMGHIIFGSFAYDFHTVSESFLSIMLLAFGFHFNFNYDLFAYQKGFIGYMYYIGFMILFLILLNIFITIIIICYATASEYFEANEEEKLASFNIINFLKEEYELFWSKSKGRLEEIRLKAGKSNNINEIMRPSTVETSGGRAKINVARKQIAIDSIRLREMYNKVDCYLHHNRHPNQIREQYKDNAPIVLLSRFLSNTDLNLTSAKQTQDSNKEIFYVVPNDKSEEFCAKKRQKDMKLIVEYLLKAHKDKNESKEKKKKPTQKILISNKMIEAHEELISTMNATVLEMINSIQQKKNRRFASKSTNVTFDDLGYELVPDDEVNQ